MLCTFRRGFNWYLILLEAHCAGRQKHLIPILDGERQVLVKHLQVSLYTWMDESRCSRPAKH